MKVLTHLDTIRMLRTQEFWKLILRIVHNENKWAEEKYYKIIQHTLFKFEINMEDCLEGIENYNYEKSVNRKLW